MLVFIISVCLAWLMAAYWQDRCKAGWGWIFFFSLTFSFLFSLIIAKYSSIKYTGKEKRPPNVFTLIIGAVLFIMGVLLFAREFQHFNMYNRSTLTFLKESQLNETLLLLYISIGLIGFSIYASRILNTPRTVKAIKETTHFTGRVIQYPFIRIWKWYSNEYEKL